MTTKPTQSETPTPRADVAKVILLSSKPISPRENDVLELLEKTERELSEAKKEIERLTKALQSECDHEWEYHDDSFDHEFGTERIPPYQVCLKCNLEKSYEAPEID
jgi:hypothetical protein